MTLNQITHRQIRSPSLCVRAVGDVNFSRSIGNQITTTPGYNPLPPLKELLGEAQLGLFNLECNPVSDQQNTDSRSTMIAPASFLANLRQEFNIASIANNHTMDAGTKAFLETIETLDSNNYTTVGGGQNVYLANEMKILNENSLRIGVIACADFVYTPSRHGNDAGKNRPGVSIFNPKELIKRVNTSKKDIDILICSIHTGLEFNSYPDPAMIRDARSLIDAGAHIILIHHAHTRQGIEIYKDGLIAYGLGNFIFDISDPYMQQGDASTDSGLILDIFVDQLGVAGYKFWLSRIHMDGRTSILSDLDQHENQYQEQLVLNRNLLDSLFIKREWKKVSKQYMKNRCYSLYEAIKTRNISRFFRLLFDLKRRENRRWIAGLFSR